jgi:hypothetical protein
MAFFISIRPILSSEEMGKLRSERGLSNSRSKMGLSNVNFRTDFSFRETVSFEESPVRIPIRMKIDKIPNTKSANKEAKKVLRNDHMQKLG